MKKFLSRLFFFLITLLIIAFVADYSFSRLLEKTSGYPGEMEVWNDIYRGKANCEIAIYGSSRAWVHFDPQILSDSLQQSCYNFGMDGHNFRLQYLRHLELVRHNKKPAHIILSVDMFTLEKRKDLYEPDQFLPFMLWNNNVREYTEPYIGYTNADYYIPLIRYAGKYKALRASWGVLRKKKSKEKYRSNGFRGMDRNWTNDLENAQAGKNIYVVKPDKNSMELLERFIRECKENKIELTLVYAPEFLEGQQFVSNRQDIMNIYKRLAAENSLSFLDYSSDSLCLVKRLFYNASHLNKEGASIFSSKLAHELKGMAR